MSNQIVQKMASGGFVYLTPKKEYIFKGQTFKKLNDCYECELSACEVRKHERVFKRAQRDKELYG